MLPESRWPRESTPSTSPWPLQSACIDSVPHDGCRAGCAGPDQRRRIEFAAAYQSECAAPQPGGLTNKSGPAAQRAAEQERQGRRDAARPLPSARNSTEVFRALTERHPPAMIRPAAAGVADLAAAPDSDGDAAMRTSWCQTLRDKRLPTIGPRPRMRCLPRACTKTPSCPRS